MGEYQRADSPPMCANSPHFLVSRLLHDAGFRHAFFTREGGVSAGPYSSLNFSFAVGDQPDAVRSNLARAAAALGIATEQLYYLSQVHGRTVVTLDATLPASEVQGQTGDALVSLPGNHACAVRTADCVPILIADPDRRIVGAIHAGWRGVVANGVAASVATAVEIGARPSRLLAAIGPHISVDHFEVGDEVASELARVAGTDEVVRRVSGQRPRVDLLRIVRHQLVDSGVDAGRIEFVGGCTASEPNRFFSYRRDGTRGGRHLSAIVGAS